MAELAALVSAGQLLDYSLDIVKSLAKLQTALKTGHSFLADEQASISQLKQFISGSFCPNGTIADSGFAPLLESIKTTVDRLLDLLEVKTRRRLVSILVLRRTELNEAFAALERKKSSLILQFAAQNSTALASLCMDYSIDPSEEPTMSKHSPTISQSSTSSSFTEHQGGPPATRRWMKSRLFPSYQTSDQRAKRDLVINGHQALSKVDHSMLAQRNALLDSASQAASSQDDTAEAAVPNDGQSSSSAKSQNPAFLKILKNVMKGKSKIHIRGDNSNCTIEKNRMNDNATIVVGGRMSISF